MFFLTWVLCVVFHSARSREISDLSDGTCRDKVSMCYTYDPIICVVYRSWAEIQCACFCKTHNHGSSAVPIPATMTPPTIRTSNQVTSSTIRTPHFLTPSTIKTPHFLTPSTIKTPHFLTPLTMTTPYHVNSSVPSFISCFTCEDYLTFRCRSFATECVNTCMIRYRDGKLESKCTMDLECRNSQQSEFLHYGSSTRCCRTNRCVSDTLQEATRTHQAQTGSQSSSAVAMLSSRATQPLPMTTKQTVGSTTKSTTTKTLNTTPVKSTSSKSTFELKTSSSPATTPTTRSWSFVTIPIGRRRILIKIKAEKCPVYFT